MHLREQLVDFVFAASGIQARCELCLAVVKPRDQFEKFIADRHLQPLQKFEQIRAINRRAGKQQMRSVWLTTQ